MFDSLQIREIADDLAAVIGAWRELLAGAG
jgi:hypothetical protein